MIRVGWGEDNPAFRQVFTSLFMPDADPFESRIFNEFQRLSAPPEDAARFVESLIQTDVRDLATRVRTPALVIHLDGDQIVPFESGREIAALIPGARLLSLEGRNHAISPQDDAYPHFADVLRGFFGADLEARTASP
jgi:pimeloyl-ACP methyl ester carboxylesterase